MKNLKKKLNILFFMLLAALIIFTAFLFNSFDNSLPPRSGRIMVPALKDTVQITFDAKGIPQIWARNETDAYFTMGYLHASDRLFQMDLTRRISQGKLSELLGSAVLEFDIQQRIVGHTRIARKYISRLSDKSKKYLESYAKGVNYYVGSCKALPFEYTLLGKGFEKWTIYDCLTILSFQTWFSNMLVSRDDFYVKLVEKLGIDALKSFQIEYPAWAPFTVPQGEKIYSRRKDFINGLNKRLFGGEEMPFLMARSSNSWVISPRRSESGRAMLASDPHLEVERLPQFWYYLGLHAEKENVNGLGITTPGIPFIVMGHNGKAAYAFTVGGIDVADYYRERIDKKDSTRYLTAEGWKKFSIHHEVIKIAGAESPKEIDVKETVHGPVIFEEDSLSALYSLRWAGYEVDLAKSADAGFRLIRIDNYDNFRRTVTSFGALDANWTYADINGNIGYQLGTPIPVRREDDEGSYPLAGWEKDRGWRGFQPLDKTPHRYNPSRGWLATCNNKQDDDNLDYDLKGIFAPDRIMRITELLNSKEKFSMEDMKRFQMDTRDVFLTKWNSIIADLFAALAMPAWEKRIRAWNGDCGAGSKEAAVVNQFLYELRKMTFEDELGAMHKKISRLWLYDIYTEQDERWFDNIHTKEVIEKKRDIALSALRKALSEVKSKTWGDLQKLTMRHPLSVVPILSRWLDLEFLPIRRGGTPGTLNSSFYFKDKEGFKSIVGPSWRFVIDFSDPDGAQMVLPAGNSGNPRSPHYKDFLPLWKNGARWNVPIHYDKVKERAVSVLELAPTGGTRIR